ncbi:SGNH/GDSL hydrolase family protein [Rudanella paleaurantiibacter]|uniref:SGNH/GDSL hydrolase family protein n=1 Tax=Rudanella paleaurantiibacter TaxID=2614655 RepID=UPI00162AB23C|nr:SGNH/GDSL hydrolase family protein [Rudanella paleaurantiibacter]
MKRIVALFGIGLCLSSLSFAQTPQTTAPAAQTAVQLTWWNPAQSDGPVIEGQGWTGKALLSPYDRLPAVAQKTVRPAVWNLSRHATGLLIRFRANTNQISVRYAVNGNLSLTNMSTTGASGVDLYARNSDGEWLWCNGRPTYGDTIRFTYTGLQPSEPQHQKGREYQLYLPLGNSLKWLEIGVPTGSAFTPLPVRPYKPIVVYGTSIAHGYSASRAGMSWVNILGRKLDQPMINLAFSGNGRMEKEVYELLPELDARVYVLDCLPNLISSTGIPLDTTRARTLQAVRLLKQKRPNTPILLVDHAGYTDGGTNPGRRQLYEEINNLQHQIFTQLKAEGIQDLYLLPYSALNLDAESMVDGTHPSDFGMLQYAEAYERVLRPILNEPAGTLSTTRARTQSRDASIYDWETRHRAILARLKAKPPRIVFFGNSITHYWAGEPQAPIARGTDSWNAMMEPLGVQNMGFGWDRIENVLWRVYHGELDGYTAEQVVLMVGTNNIGLNTNDDIVAGLKFLGQAIKTRQPTAQLLLIGILPRRNEEKRIARLNEDIARIAGELNATFAQPGTVFLGPDGKIDESLFTDGLHPNAQGYRLLADKMRPYLKPIVQPVVQEQPRKTRKK